MQVKLKGVEENDISQGFVLCDPNNPIKSGRIFDAQVCKPANFKGIFTKIFLSFLKVVVLDYKSIICPGKTFVMHLQAIIEEVTIKALICLVGTRATIVTVSKISFIELYS